MRNAGSGFVRHAKWALGIIALVLVAIVGCLQWREFCSPPPPEVAAEWRTLLAELRAFERTIGYQETKNFLALSAERESFPFCGLASRFELPYSYEDPAIQWFDTLNESDCRKASSENDVYFGHVEAMGEIGTPVTPSMLNGTLDRFVYLVIHEDCHDQFALPYGVEEALCNVITYAAMEQFSKDKYRWYSRENRSIRNYTGAQLQQTRTVIEHYGRLERLYARFRRRLASPDALLRERAAVFADTERALKLDRGVMNNVVFANMMTYSRHYPYLETVYRALGSDLTHFVEFFRHVDTIKPARAEVMKRLAIGNEKSAEFVQAYEAAVIETTAKALAERRKSAR